MSINLNNVIVESFKTEERLLVCAARARLDSETTERMRSLVKAGPDWERLVRFAALHGMRPLLYWHLNAACSDLVPPEILEQLADEFRHNGIRNLYVSRQLLSVMERLEQEGILAIAYKGPVLAESVYENLSLREFVDLDILVRLEDVKRAKDVLASLGYMHNHAVGEAQAHTFHRYHCEYQFRHEKHHTLVELQWGIAPRFFSLPLRYDEWWTRTETTTLMEKRVRTLGAEDLLFVLCIHGGKHLWERLEWVCGVAELLRRRADLDWQQVLEQATEAHAMRMLLLGLFLAHKLLDAELPAQVLRKIERDERVKALASRVCSILFSEQGRGHDEVHTTLFHLQSREHWQDRFRYCYRLAATSTEWDWREQPALAPDSIFYLPGRAVRLTKKYVPRVVRSIRDKYHFRRNRIDAPL